MHDDETTLLPGKRSKIKLLKLFSKCLGRAKRAAPMLPSHREDKRNPLAYLLGRN